MSQQKPVALVTGGAKRMGRAFVEALSEDGYNVAIHYNSSSNAAVELAGILKAQGVETVTIGADLGNSDQVLSIMDQAHKALGPISVLVNSASIFRDDTWENQTADSFRQHLDVNTLAPALLSQSFAKQAPDGAMIFNLLDYKLFNINADFFSYTMSKAALKTMTEMLARTLAPRVRVNGVAPGLTLPSPYHSDEEFVRLHNDNPLQCGPTPEDMVRTLRYFLATPCVSGQIVCVDGGQHFDPRLTRDVFGAI